MKKCFLLSLVCFCIYSVSTAQAGAAASLSDYQWLLGKWERTNNRAGQITYEKWTKESDTKFNCLGWTMRGKDTVFSEKVTLTIKGNDIFYIADVSENATPVPFKIIQQSEKSFVCSNPEHDFPKQIAYTKNEGNMMTAVISGGGREIPYQFKKVAD